jgi:hypothetical protein
MKILTQTESDIAVTFEIHMQEVLSSYLHRDIVYF